MKVYDRKNNAANNKNAKVLLSSLEAGQIFIHKACVFMKTAKYSVSYDDCDYSSIVVFLGSLSLAVNTAPSAGNYYYLPRNTEVVLREGATLYLGG